MLSFSNNLKQEIKFGRVYFLRHLHEQNAMAELCFIKSSGKFLFLLERKMLVECNYTKKKKKNFMKIKILMPN